MGFWNSVGEVLNAVAESLPEGKIEKCWDDLEKGRISVKEAKREIAYLYREISDRTERRRR